MTAGRDYPGSAGTRVTSFVLALRGFKAVAIQGLSFVRCPRTDQLSGKDTENLDRKTPLGDANRANAHQSTRV